MDSESVKTISKVFTGTAFAFIGTVVLAHKAGEALMKQEARTKTRNVEERLRHMR